MIKKPNKKMLLTLNPELYARLEQKSKERVMTVQEYLYEMIRRDVIDADLTPKKKSKAGRPPNVDEPLIAAFARKR